MLLEAIAAASRRSPPFRGKANFIRRVRRWRTIPTDDAWLVRRRNGDQVVLPVDSAMCWQTAFTGIWDDAIIAHMVRYLRPGTVALDIGASVGLWTVPLARAARITGAEVVAIEPLPGNARWLNTNLSLNGLLDEVIVHHLALGSANGTARIESSEMTGGSAALAIAGGVPLAMQGTEIALRRLDDLDLPRPVSFIKMDVEGLECEVLRGASTTIKRDRPVIFGEFDQTFLRLRGEETAPLLRNLVSLRYQIFSLKVIRTRPWRAWDRVTLGRIEPPFSELQTGDLLLLPD